MNSGDLISTGDGGYTTFGARQYRERPNLLSFVAFFDDEGESVMVPETR